MAVFPESMDKLNADDVRSSLPVMENYIRYMCERVEFAMRNMTKNVNAAGVSSVEMYILLTALQNEMATLQSTVSGLNGTVNGLGTQLSNVQSSITSLENRMSTIEDSITSMGNRMSAVENSVSSLEHRVAALENPTT